MSKTARQLTWQDVTPEPLFLNRRALIASAMATGALAAAPAHAATSAFSIDETPNTWEEITTYNNFYEFGTDKGDPAKYAGAMETSPWTVQVEGLVDSPGAYDLRELIDDIQVEERIYRLRCVEAWSMVIPWTGFELRRLLDKLGVQPDAQYVAFETAMLPDVMPGLRRPVVPWPYVEGLRMDEAMHPLTIMATGLYGKPVPNQNGAPMRLVVPWKYGFKSIKSIVRISLVAEEPPTSWNVIAPTEYGFFANVNPKVDHPRWSQASERKIGGGLFARRVPTQMFNGYEDEVAELYAGMDLTKFY